MAIVGRGQADSEQREIHRKRPAMFQLMLEAREYLPVDGDPGTDDVDEEVALLQHLSWEMGTHAELFPRGWTKQRTHAADVEKFRAVMLRVMMRALMMMRIDSRYSKHEE